MLRSLEIRNFRALEAFRVERLGRVNLIVGKNNSGKSTVLEALRIYAENGRGKLLEGIAKEHDEPYRLMPGTFENAITSRPYEGFFFGRQFPTIDDTYIRIGEIQQNRPGTTQDRRSISDPGLLIEHVIFAEQQITETSEEEETRGVRRKRISKQDRLTEDTDAEALLVSRNGRSIWIFLDADRASQELYRTLLDPPFDSLGPNTPCAFIPTQLVSMDDLADIWDRIALIPEHADTVRSTLRIIAPTFENIIFIRIDKAPSAKQEMRRTAIVKLTDAPMPVPLRSLGDGMLRVLQLALKLFPAKGGFLLIDEFENGLHYSVQVKVWEMIFEMAARLDIQVFATTHSWDCIEAFAQVTAIRPDDGVLFHMGRSVRNSDRGQIIATVFAGEELVNLTQADVELR